MKFGFFLPMSGIFANIKNVVRVTKEAEALGYDSVWMYDMSLTQTRENYQKNLLYGCCEDADLDGDPNFVEPFTTMAALAQATTKIEIGSAVIQLPFYNPILVAKQAANIDNLSDGRLNLGVGIGGAISFFRAGYGHLHMPFQKRGRMFDEYVRVIRQLWSSKSPSSFEGKYIQFTDLELYPKPVSGRLLLGSGVREKGLRRVMDYGDGVILPYRPPRVVKENVNKIKEECSRRGRDFGKMDVVQTIFTSVGPTTEAARTLLGPTVTSHATGFGGKAMSTDEHSAHSDRPITVDDLLEMSLVGTADDVIKGVERWQEAGLKHAIMAMVFRGKDISAFFETMKTISKEVIPSFR